ncbi:MAG TPA: Ig-like domain-containing protein [Pyrinomonadaceae bacterium]
MFPRWKNFPRFGARALTKLLLTVAFVFALQLRAEAAGTFIPANGRVDVVHDSARDIVYITSGGSVLRYHLGTNSFQTPFNLGGNLAGLDLSPDGNTLVVADRTRTEANIWVHVIDLRTGASSKALTTREFMEGGTFTVAYGSDNQLLVTTTFEGSGWVPLRRFNPATGVWTKLNNLLAADGGTLSQDTMLAASGDRSVIGFAEANISDGRWGSYNVAGGTLVHRTWYENGTSAFNFEIGVNKDGTQYAIPTYKGTFIYNASFVKVGTLGTYAGPEPIGVVYHPVEDIAYFPWTQTTQVRAFNMNTLTQVAAYDFQDNFVWNGGWAFQQGRMKMSRDGSLLFCTVTGGVRFLRLYEPLAAEDQSVTTVENTPVNVTLSGSVGNGGALSYRVATQPAHGTLSGTGADLVYTPEPNYEGPDSFTFKSVYGPAESAAATVNITVTHDDANNDAPTADDQSVTVDEDGSTAVTLTGSDPNGSPVTFEVMDGPAHGSVTGTAPNLVYTPAPDFFGSDSFTFSASNGTSSDVGHVHVTINSVNDAPTVTGQSLATNEDTPLSVTLTASDVDNSPLYMSYMVFSPPAHGTLSGTGANLVYTPDPNYNGPDSFGFKATDGEDDSNDATVNISVTPVNDAPVTSGRSVTLDEDTPASITLAGSDADGDALTWTIVNAPTRGTLSGTAPNLVYTPAANNYGGDSFTFRVGDGTASSPVATVSISIAAVNDAPTAVSQSLLTYEDRTMSFRLYGNDAEYDPITYEILSQPTHGTLTGPATALVYTPESNWSGTDSFTFKTNDGKADSAVATISIRIDPVNDAPVANPQTVDASEDTPANITLTGSDQEGDALGWNIVEYPKHGYFAGSLPNLVYKVSANYNGPDSFIFRVHDGKAWSEAVTVTINVAAVNDAPAANAQTAATSEDAAVAVVLSASDVDGDALGYTVVGAPAHGTLSGAAPNLVYTPAPNYNGPDSFGFKVNDGKADSNVATVSVVVNAVNDAPVANGQPLATNEDSAVAVTLTASDVDGDALTYMLITTPQHGSLTGTVPNLIYTPAPNYSGPDSFSFVVYDGKAQSATATVTFNVAAVNDAPVAVADVTSVFKNASAVNLALLSNDSDVDGDALTITSVTQPANGSVTIAPDGKSVNYTPRKNYRGNDLFYYTVGDGRGGTATASVTVTVK